MGIFVPIDFTARFDQALKDFKGFSNQVSKQVGGIEGSFNNLNTAVKLFVGGFVVKKVLDGLGSMIHEAAEAEENFIRMKNALRASGDFSEQNALAFKHLAEEIANTSTFTDDAVISSVALAKQFGLTNRETEKLLRVSADVATLWGTDFNTTVKQLGQTFDGTAGKLAEMAPELRGLTAEQLRNGAAVDILGKKYKDFAETGLASFSGQMSLVSKNFGELQEDLGSAFVENEAVIQLIKVLNSGLGDLRVFVNENKQALIEFVFDGVSVAIKAFYHLIEVMKFFTLTVKGVKSLFSSEKFGFKEAAEVREKFDKLSLSLVEFNDKVEQAKKKSGQFTTEIKGVASGFDALTPKIKRVNSDVLKGVEALEKSLEKISENEGITLSNEYIKAFKIIENARKQGFRTEEQARVQLGKLGLQYEQKIAEFRKKSFEEVATRIQELQKDPIKILFKKEDLQRPGGRLGISPETSDMLGAGAGLVQNVLGGANGAKQLLGSIASTVGVALLGPVGTALGPIVEALSAGPEQVKAMVQEFAKALPDLVVNLVEAIPVFIEELANQMPVIIERIVERMPEIIQALIKAMPRVALALALLMPRVVIALVKGAGQFVAKILEGAFRFVGEILRGAGQFIAKIVKGISGGAFGGKGGFFGSHGSGGLGVRIGGFKFKGGAGTSQDVSVAGNQFASKAGGSANVSVALKVGENQLAKAIIDLRKLGFNLEPI